MRSIYDNLVRAEVHLRSSDTLSKQSDWHAKKIFHNGHLLINRMWKFHQGDLIYIHRIEPLAQGQQVLYHAHYAQSVMRILSGSYFMEVGFGDPRVKPLVIPPVSLTITLHPGCVYEMFDDLAWHSVTPPVGNVYSIMVNEAPVGAPPPGKEPFECSGLTSIDLPQSDIDDILGFFRGYYQK